MTNAPQNVLCLSSQVVFGPVGNSAAVPALQAAGCVVMQIPTIILSAHPGHGKPVVQPIGAEVISNMLEGLFEAGHCETLSGLMTGYFASAEQVKIVAAMIKRIRHKNHGLYVLVDPVIGDEAGLYVDVAVANAIRDELLPLATCITPNRFELSWLMARPIKSLEDLQNSPATHQEILATSIPTKDGHLLTVVQADKTIATWATIQHHGVPHGTGDFLSGLYLAGRMMGEPPARAMHHAMEVLVTSITASLGKVALDLNAGLRVMRQTN